MTPRPFVLFTLFLLLSLGACSDKAKRDSGLLPGSTGGSLEVMVVMEDSLWTGEVGHFLRSQMAAPMPGLPQSESWYKLVHIAPKNFNELLRRSHLILLVELDSSNQARRLNDYWAKPQFMLSYRGTDQASLLFLLRSRLEEDVKALRQFENHHILGRIAKQKAPSSKLMKQAGLQMTIPANLELSTDREDISIYWSRNLKSDQCLMVYTRPLKEETTMLGGDILPVRDSVCQLYIPGQFENSYMTTEYRMAPMINPHEIGGAFALETRGLWRVEGDFMGGPFLSYTLFDEKNQRIITLEGFVFAPEIDKRQLLFELESVMHSLKL
jgi:hypothetical protein